MCVQGLSVIHVNNIIDIGFLCYGTCLYLVLQNSLRLYTALVPSKTCSPHECLHDSWHDCLHDSWGTKYLKCISLFDYQANGNLELKVKENLVLL